MRWVAQAGLVALAVASGSDVGSDRDVHQGGLGAGQAGEQLARGEVPVPRGLGHQAGAGAEVELQHPVEEVEAITVPLRQRLRDRAGWAALDLREWDCSRQRRSPQDLSRPPRLSPQLGPVVEDEH